jgi:hypothetical protein
LDETAWTRLEHALVEVPGDLRRPAAARWVEAAQLEHASIASFDRFSLELLALGAPATLLERAHHAALDEIRHARLSFRIASALSGTPLGPGPLSLARVAFNRPMDEIVLSAVLEGCIVETVAAAHAARAAEGAAHDAIAGVLRMIARDELAHAELAFSFVGWALALHGEPLRAALRPHVEERLSQVRAAPPDRDDPGLEGLGLLSGLTRRSVRQIAIDEDVAPALRELLDVQ